MGGEDNAAAFEAAAGDVLRGGSTFEAFARRTSARWRALTKFVMRRWRQPAWVSVEDVEQDLLMGAWRALARWDPVRAGGAGKLGAFVVWNAVDYAKKRAHKARGCARHRGADGNPGRFDVPYSQWSPEHAESLADILSEHPPTQADLLEARQEAREGAEIAREECRDALELLVVDRLYARDDVEEVVAAAYGDPRMRVSRQWSDREQAAHAVRAAAGALALRLEGEGDAA